MLQTGHTPDLTLAQLILRSPQGLLEGAFWSLFVEVKFYIFASSLYFAIGRKKLIYALIAIFLIGIVFDNIPSIAGSSVRGEVTTMNQFGWFAAGALFYCYFYERKPFFFWSALWIAFVSAIAQGGHNIEAGFAGILVTCLFGSAVYFPFFQRVLATRTLLFLGAVSYPFYLIHENMSISLIVQISKSAPWIPSLVLPLLPMAVVLIIAYIIVTKLEPNLLKVMKAVGRQFDFSFKVKPIS